MRFIRLTALVAAVVPLAGCEHADPLAVDNREATFANVQASVFNTNCALSGCHDGGSSSLPGILDLREGQAYANIVGVASIQRAGLSRVSPNNPDDSYLVRKIEGGPDIGGSRMPFGRSALSQDQIDLIREWIENGAEEN